MQKQTMNRQPKNRAQFVVLPNVLTIIQKEQPVSDIPNAEGFELFLIAPNGLALPVTVRKDANGCHYCADETGAYRGVSAFRGWINR